MSALPTSDQELLVTVAIPALDEEGAIGECLDRIRAQTWSRLDIAVADGGSRDRTREIVRDHAARDPRVRLVENPRRLQSAGLNEILATSRSDVVVRLDARSFVDDRYVARCVELLAGTQSAVVGGRMVPRAGEGRVARGIAVANAAPWGAGPAKFHRAGAGGPAETVYLGAFVRSWLDLARGWSEDVGVNEDYELNHRIRALGGQVWLEPDLEVGYQPRTSYRALAKQYFRYGRSKATVARRLPRSIRPRQVAPALLVPVLAAAAAPGLVGRAGRLGLVAYVVGLAGLALRGPGAAGERISAGLAALVMHWSWAAGAWFGSVRPFAAAGSGGS
jgi:glycosyltransferase involved in cell wall biosynthesis